MSDQAGVITQRYGYDSYGKRKVLKADGTADTNPAKTRYGFTGREHEASAEDLMYFRSRYFHATLGRFTKHDVDYLDGLNLYAGYFGMWGGLDPFGHLTAKSVGDGPQVPFWGPPERCLNVYGWAAATFWLDANEIAQGAAAGGAHIIYSRDESWEIETCDGQHQGSGGGVTYHLDRINFNKEGGLVVDLDNALGGSGGPIPMTDGSIAAGYTELISRSSSDLLGIVLNQERIDNIQGGMPPRDANRGYRECGQKCHKGFMEVTIHADYVLGSMDWRDTFNFTSRENPIWYDGNPLSGPEFGHKPWSTLMPRAWHNIPVSSIDFNIRISWDGCGEEPVITVGGTASALPAGPQRRDDGQRSPYWNPNEDGDGWNPPQD